MEIIIDKNTEIKTMQNNKQYISLNKLPFLQSQILQKLYLDIHNNIKTTIEDIAQITNYKKESKILNDAIKALITKEFIEGDFEKGLYNLVVRKNDYKHKNYSKNILNFQYVNKINDKSHSLHLLPLYYVDILHCPF